MSSTAPEAPPQRRYLATIEIEFDDLDHLLGVMGSLISSLTTDAAKGRPPATMATDGRWHYRTEERDEYLVGKEYVDALIEWGKANAWGELG